MNVRLPDSLQTVPDAVQSFPETVRQANPRTRLIWSVAGVLIVIALAWYASGLFASAPPPKVQVAPVRVAAAVRKNIIVYERTVGTIVANATVQVTAQVGGQIVSIAFKEGDIVKKGDVLFQLDPRPFQAALEQAQGAMKRDQATLLSDRKDSVRYTTLQKLGAASGQQTDQAVAAAGAMAASVVSDKAAVDAAKLNLAYSTIHSPVDGKTGPILIQIGNIISASGVSPLVTITQIHPVKVSFFLPQTDLPQIQARMAQHDMTASIHVQGAGGKTLTAPVDFVSNAVGAQTGTIELRATFANLDNVLVPGQLADTSVAINHIDNATVVPHDAVNQGPDGAYVWLVDKQMKAQMKDVAVLYDDGTQTAINGDVKPGEQVITVGALRVVSGSKVDIAKAASDEQQAPVGAQ